MSALVLALHCWLVWVGPLPGDHWAATQAYSWSLRPHWLRDIGELFQGIATPVPALAIVGIGFGLLLIGGRRGEAEGLVVAGSATLVCALLKTIFGPTPLWVMLNPNAGANYPSGHVTFATATIGYLGLCAWRHRLPLLTALAAVIIVCMGPERVVTGVHTVSDVIGGYLLGGAWLILADLTARQGISVSSLKRGG